MKEFFENIGKWLYDQLPTLLPVELQDFLTSSNMYSPEEIVELEQKLSSRYLYTGIILLGIPFICYSLMVSKPKRKYKRRKYTKRRTYKRRKK